MNASKEKYVFSKTMESELKNLISTYVHAYQKQILNEYPMTEEHILQRLWQNTVKQGSLSTETKKRPKTAYQHFFALRREELNNDSQNQLSFGELSKQVSQQWKKMSIDKKNKYRSTETEISALPQTDKPITFDNILQFADEEYIDDRTTFETNDSDNDDENIDEEDDFIFEGEEEDC